jgi:hypothetical protein
MADGRTCSFSIRAETRLQIGGHRKPRYVGEVWIQASDGRRVGGGIRIEFRRGATLGHRLEANLWLREYMRELRERTGGTLREQEA